MQGLDAWAARDVGFGELELREDGKVRAHRSDEPHEVRGGPELQLGVPGPPNDMEFSGERSESAATTG